MAINEGFLFAVSTNGKFIDIFRMIDIVDDESGFHKPEPILRVTKSVTQTWGVTYFAPVDIEASPKHKDTMFVKTKTGVLIMKFYANAVPEFIAFLNVPTSSKFDFEVSKYEVALIA